MIAELVIICVYVLCGQIPASAVEMPASMNSAQLDVQFGNWDATPTAVSVSAESGSGISFTADVALQQSHYGAPTHRQVTHHLVTEMLFVYFLFGICWIVYLGDMVAGE